MTAADSWFFLVRVAESDLNKMRNNLASTGWQSAGAKKLGICNSKTFIVVPYLIGHFRLGVLTIELFTIEPCSVGLRTVGGLQ